MYKGKGIIFVGCSFTWGGGLEYFAPFKDIPNTQDGEFDCLYDLMNKHPKFKISTSGFLVNGKPVNDDHQTIECHKIIADSIINSIEKDNIILH